MRSEGLNSYWSVGSGVYNLDIKVDPSLGDKRKGILNDEFLYETASFPECHGATIVGA